MEIESHIYQLKEYIKRNLKKGYTIDSLKVSLINQGYTRISIDTAVEIANKELSEEIQPIKEKPQITYKLVYPEESKSISVNPTKISFWRKLFQN